MHSPKRLSSVCMDVELDLSMRTAEILEGWSLNDYQSEYKEILQTLSTGLQPRVIDGDQWYKNNQYLFYEDLRHDLMGVYNGPISGQVTQALFAHWNSFASVSTLI